MRCILIVALLVWHAAAAGHYGYAFVGPEGHGPLGVMGDHVHRRGEWMLSYRYVRMRMNGNRDGGRRVGADAVVDPQRYGFTVAPLSMTTEMHMPGVMVAPGDHLTLMAMLPYVRKSMDHGTRSGVAFTTESEGFGDLKLSALLQLVDRPARSLHLHVGLSLPTGDTDARDDNPRCAMLGNCPARLPYPMQIGSGTVDPVLGLTWRADAGRVSWGAQARARFRVGRNDHGYSQGEEYLATVWAARRVGARASVSARLAGRAWTDYDGRDRDVAVSHTGFSPTAEADQRDGRRLDIGLGLNWLAGGGHRLAVELIRPLSRHLDGPQLQSDGSLVIGWQYAR